MKVKEIHVTIRQPGEQESDMGVPNVRHLKQVQVERPPEPEATEPWHTPLQQMLDVLKARASSGDEATDDDLVLVSPTPLGEGRYMAESMNFCKRCGSLVLPQSIRESKSPQKISRLRQVWTEMARKHTGALPVCAIKHKV